jgi:hypothetical protein
MTYRILDPQSEWPFLEGEFARNNSPLPNPQLAIIIGAFNKLDAIVGFIVIQLQIHVEPIYSTDPNCVRGLVRQAELFLKEHAGASHYFAHASTPKVAELCKAFGMQPTQYPIFMKRLD